LLPSECCIRIRGKECVNTPEWIVSILDNENEYMIALVCNEHREVVTRITEGTIGQLHNNSDRCMLRFTKIKSVATACSINQNVKF
jgi:hypothetical protein